MNPIAKLWGAFKAWLKSLDEAWDEEMGAEPKGGRVCRDVED